MVKRKVAAITDTVRQHLAAIVGDRADQVEARVRAEYKKRRLLEELVDKVYLVRQGPSFSTQVPVPSTVPVEYRYRTGSCRIRAGTVRWGNVVGVCYSTEHVELKYQYPTKVLLKYQYPVVEIFFMYRSL